MSRELPKVPGYFAKNPWKPLEAASKAVPRLLSKSASLRIAGALESLVEPTTLAKLETVSTWYALSAVEEPLSKARITKS